MITTIEEAFKILDNSKEGVPFDAIRFLYEHEPCKEITDKIVYALENAYNNSVYYDEREGVFYDTPLWYAVVAEKHISAELIGPVISLFVSSYEDWDFLNEQGGYLVGKMCEKLPTTAPEIFFRAIYQQVTQASSYPYLYLYDAILFINKEEHKDDLVSLLSAKNFKWFELYCDYLADIKLVEAKPMIRRIYEKTDDPAIKKELKQVLNRFNAEGDELETIRAFSQQRAAWDEHYKLYAESFTLKENDFNNLYN